MKSSFSAGLLHALTASALVLLACSPPPPGPGPGADAGVDAGTGPTGTGAMTTQNIGADGGTVSVEGARLEVPDQALPANASISVTSLSTPAPAGAVTPLYRFEPAGTRFAKPVTVRLDVPASATGDLRIFWSRETGEGFDQLTTTREGNTLVAAVTHFSQGFGAPAQGGETVAAPQCPAPPTTGCTNIAPSPTTVVAVTSTDPAPTPIGGTIAPGRYLLAKRTFYVAPNTTVDNRGAEALEFCGNAVQAHSVSDGSMVRRFAGTYALSGTSVSFSFSCEGAAGLTNGYTATSTALFLFEDRGVNNGVREWVVSEFHRR